MQKYTKKDYRNLLVGIILIITGILFIMLTGCISSDNAEQIKEYTGVLQQASYPTIGDFSPLCMSWVLKTNLSVYYLTEDEKPFCASDKLYGFTAGEQVIVKGYKHYLEKYNSKETYPCIEVTDIKDITENSNNNNNGITQSFIQIDGAYVTGISIRDGDIANTYDGDWSLHDYIRFNGGSGGIGTLHYVFKQPCTINSIKIKACGNGEKGLRIYVVTAFDNSMEMVYSAKKDVYFDVYPEIKTISLPLLFNVKQVNILFTVPVPGTTPAFYEIEFM